MNKLWCMPCVWRNCYQCINFALLHFHSLSSWYPDLWFSTLNHLNNLWHYLPKWYILPFLSSLWNSSSQIFPFFFSTQDNWISCAQVDCTQHFRAKEEPSSFFFHHHLLSSLVFLCSCISLYHCGNKGIKFNGFPYL